MKLTVALLSLTVLFSASRKEIHAPKNCMSAEEMKLYNLIMEYRKSKNLKSIPLSFALTQVAQAHTRDL